MHFFSAPELADLLPEGNDSKTVVHFDTTCIVFRHKDEFWKVKYIPRKNIGIDGAWGERVSPSITIGLEFIPGPLAKDNYELSKKAQTTGAALRWLIRGSIPPAIAFILEKK